MSAHPNISDGFDQYLKNPLLKHDQAIIDLFLDPPGVSHTKSNNGIPKLYKVIRCSITRKPSQFVWGSFVFCTH